MRRHSNREDKGALRTARSRLLAHGMERGARAPDSEIVVIVHDRDEGCVTCQDRLEGGTEQPDNCSKPTIFWRRRIHRRRAALRQPQSARPVNGAGASPGREFADTIAGDHGACRPRRAERRPRRQGLRTAKNLAGAVRKQICRSGFPHEPTWILPEHLGRGRENGLGLRGVHDEVEHRRMLTALPGAEYRDWALHGATNRP